MLTYLKSKKFRILTILAGLSYIFIIGSSLYDGWDDVQRGFVEGSNDAYDPNPKTVYTNKSISSHYISLHPKNGYLSFPDSIRNIHNNVIVKANFQHAIILTNNNLPSATTKWLNAFKLILTLSILVIYLIIPFHFYRFIGLIEKDIIFERENVRLLRRLGIELLVVYFGMVLFNLMSYLISRSMFAFSDYELIMDSMDGIWLLFGISALLIAEILEKARVLKEEQELTI